MTILPLCATITRQKTMRPGRGNGVLPVQWVATTGYALEGVTARELEALELKVVETQTSRVSFEATTEQGAAANLWLRTAGRVRLVVGVFPAKSFEELFEGTKALPWEQYIGRDYRFPITCRSVNSQLFSLSDCQAIVKKAIVERLKTRYKLQWFAENGPVAAVEAHIHKDVVTLSIDTSGAGLHERGYRKLNGPAALRETLAASLVLLTKWRGDRAFADPMCGTGTIAIEAAMIARNVAPGLYRPFAGEQLSWMGKALFDEQRERARAAVHADVQPDIFAGDIDGEAVSMARYHARQAGVAAHVRIVQAPLKKFVTDAAQGHLITNPPYGQRMGEDKDVQKLTDELGQLHRRLERWAFHVITSAQDFERWFGARADSRRELRNGPLQCRYYEYFRSPKAPRL